MSSDDVAGVVFPFLGPGIGGSHISTMTLAEELNRRGLHTLFVSPEGTPFHEELVRRGFNVAPSHEDARNHWSASEDLARIGSRRRLLKGLRLGGGYVVHCNDLPSYRSWVLPTRLAGFPVVYHHRSSTRFTVKKRLVMSRVSQAICISETTMNELGFLPDTRRQLIWNPIEITRSPDFIEKSRRNLRQTLDVTEDAELIGFVGNFWARKRPFFFIDIAAQILRQRSNVHFAVFGREGEHSEQDMRDYAADRGISNSISFLGFRSPPEGNIAALDLLIAPAVAEPFGRTLVEASLLGVPYVATDDAGHGEIGRRWGGGVLVGKEKSDNEYAAAIVAALNCPSSVRLDQSRLANLADSLSVKRHADEVVNVYKSMLR